ncbi:MAG: hypothetical protein ACLQMF_08630 [Rectinemataceae bacterium]
MNERHGSQSSAGAVRHVSGLFPDHLIAFEIENAGDDLKIVFYAMMDFRKQRILFRKTRAETLFEISLPFHLAGDKCVQKRGCDEDEKPALGSRYGNKHIGSIREKQKKAIGEEYPQCAEKRVRRYHSKR